MSLAAEELNDIPGLPPAPRRGPVRRGRVRRGVPRSRPPGGRRSVSPRLAVERLREAPRRLRDAPRVRVLRRSLGSPLGENGVASGLLAAPRRAARADALGLVASVSPRAATLAKARSIPSKSFRSLSTFGPKTSARATLRRARGGLERVRGDATPGASLERVPLSPTLGPARLDPGPGAGAHTLRTRKTGRTFARTTARVRRTPLGNRPPRPTPPGPDDARPRRREAHVLDRRFSTPPAAAPYVPRRRKRSRACTTRPCATRAPAATDVGEANAASARGAGRGSPGSPPRGTHGTDTAGTATPLEPPAASPPSDHPSEPPSDPTSSPPPSSASA